MPAGAVGDQLDVLVAVKFVGPEHQAIRAARAFQIGLGQGWALIRQMRLVVDQADRLAIAMLAQRCRELETRVAGTGDENRSLRHRGNSAASARELPMLSPLSADFGLLASSFKQRRSWPRPERWRHYLASGFEEAQERLCPRGK